MGPILPSPKNMCSVRTEADAFGAERDRVRHLLGQVGVRADAHAAVLVRPLHELRVELVDGRLRRLERLVDDDLDDLRRLRRDRAGEDLAAETVDRDRIALAEHLRPAVDAHLALRVVDEERAAADDADLAHLPADERRVARHAAAGGQDALGRGHAANVLRRRLVPDEDHRARRARPSLGVFRVKRDVAGRGAGSGVQALREEAPRADRVGLGLPVEHRAQQLVQAVGLDAEERRLRRDELLVHHLDGDARGRAGGALADATLQHEEDALLHRELDVHDVAVVAFESAPDLHELRVRLRIVLGQLRDRQRRPRAGDDVLALRVPEELAVEDVLARGGVARERNAGARVGAHVAEHHRLHVDRGAPALGDAVQLPVDDRAVVVPRAEDGADGAPELLLGALGEEHALPHLDERLELLDELLQVLRGQIGVERDAARALLLGERDLERVFLRLRLRLRSRTTSPYIWTNGGTSRTRSARCPFAGSRPGRSRR
jgi:hypothetical protein